jgi:hypothetical protein
MYRLPSKLIIRLLLSIRDQVVHKTPPSSNLPTHRILSAILQSTIPWGGSTRRRVGVGLCFPVARVTPRIEKPSPLRVVDWIRVADDDNKFAVEEFRAALTDPSKVEPIVAETGPLLAGMSNFQRWGLAVHPHSGLVRV